MNRMAVASLCLIYLLLLAACHVSKSENGKVNLPSQSIAITPPENTPISESPLGGATMTGGAVVNLTEEENGGKVSLIVNDTLQIQLVGNPTTGFTWDVENLDTGHLEQIGTPLFKPDNNLTGASGQFTLTFKALGAGVVVLRLIYHRAFEKNVPPQRIFEITVNIQD